MVYFSPARWLIIAPIAAAAFSASGQIPTTRPAEANPAQATSGRLTYQSALEGYQPFADEKTVAWKEANETVYRRGGWQAYAKEASGASSSEAHGGDSHATPPGPSMSTPMAPKKGQP